MLRNDESLLAAALIGYQQKRAKIDSAIAAISARIDRSRAALRGINGNRARKRKPFIVAARKRMAAALRRSAGLSIEKTERRLRFAAYVFGPLAFPKLNKPAVPQMIVGVHLTKPQLPYQYRLQPPALPHLLRGKALAPTSTMSFR